MRPDARGEGRCDSAPVATAAPPLPQRPPAGAALRAASVAFLPGLLLGLALAASVVGLAAYLLVLRPRLARFGATGEETRARLPGDGFVRPRVESTRATSIRAPVPVVWSWLVQLGQGRGGFYSYDVLENLAGLRIHSADRIDPALQHLAPGDLVRTAPESFGPEAGFRVLEAEACRALVLDVAAGAGTWAFVLREEGEGRTRLLVRWRLGGSRLGAAAYVLAVEIPHFLMERGMLQGIARRAERVAAARPRS